MGNLLFSPTGRIGPSEFMKGVIILIVVGIILSLPGLLGLPDVIELIGSLISIVTLWCWVVLWVKRYHDGGKSGWTCLFPIITYLFVLLIVMFVVAGGPFMELMTETMNGADEVEIAAMEEEMMRKVGLPIIIASTLVSLGLAFLFNKLINQDMHDNQYGPQGGVGETFS